jgi:DNA-binding XRE family transcriptional regulator
MSGDCRVDVINDKYVRSNVSKKRIEYLNELRVNNNISQEALAEVLSISVRTVQRIEKEHECSGPVFKKIKEYFNLQDAIDDCRVDTDSINNKIEYELKELFPPFVYKWEKGLISFKDNLLFILLLTTTLIMTVFGTGLLLFALYPLLVMYFDKDISLAKRINEHRSEMLAYYQLPTLCDDMKIIVDDKFYQSRNMILVLEGFWGCEDTQKYVRNSMTAQPRYFSLFNHQLSPVHYLSFTQVFKSKDNKYFINKLSTESGLHFLNEAPQLNVISESNLKHNFSLNKECYERLFSRVKIV